jgi:HSP20 family protein
LADKKRTDQNALANYRPVTLLDLWSGLEREIWDSWKPFTAGDSIMPRMDLYEEDGELIMKTELPGIEKKDLDISLEGDRLTIKAEKKEDIKDNKRHHTQERYYGQYFRSFTLPYAVKEDKISATLDKGVLEIKLPKADEVKAKKIEIKA